VSSALRDLARIMRDTDPGEDGQESAGEMWADECDRIAGQVEILVAALTDLVGQVEMAESEGICLPNRVAALNAQEVLRVHGRV